MDLWQELGIAPTHDRREIRRAYARRLKELNPEDDPEGFRRLRSAYERLMAAPEGAGKDGAAGGRETGAEDDGSEPDELMAAVLREIDAALADDESADAIERLEFHLREPRMQGLDKRALLEQRVLEEIARRRSVPPRLARFAIDAFQWDQGLGHLAASQRGVARDLLSIPDTEGHLRGLKQRAKRWVRKAASSWDREPLAAALLLGPCRPLWFRIAALDGLALEAVRRLFGELEAFYPGILGRHLDARTVDWWRRKLREPRGRLSALSGIIVSYYLPVILGGLGGYVFLAILLQLGPRTPWYVPVIAGAAITALGALWATVLVFKESLTTFVWWIAAGPVRSSVVTLMVCCCLFAIYLDGGPIRYLAMVAAAGLMIAASGPRDHIRYLLCAGVAWGLLALFAKVEVLLDIGADDYLWAALIGSFVAVRSWRLVGQRRSGQ